MSQTDSCTRFRSSRSTVSLSLPQEEEMGKERHVRDTSAPMQYERRTSFDHVIQNRSTIFGRAIDAAKHQKALQPFFRSSRKARKDQVVDLTSEDETMEEEEVPMEGINVDDAPSLFALQALQDTEVAKALPSTPPEAPPAKQTFETRKAKLWHLMETHMYLPFILQNYLRVALNLAVAAFIAYFLLQLVWTLKHDLAMKVDHFTQEELIKIAQCKRDYALNRCRIEERVPHMQETCMLWEACMHRNPHELGRARISAMIFADILNGFVEPISWKTMAFFLILIFGTMLIGRTSLKSQHYPYDYSAYPPPSSSSVSHHGNGYYLSRPPENTKPAITQNAHQWIKED